MYQSTEAWMQRFLLARDWLAHHLPLGKLRAAALGASQPHPSPAF